ncbi:MAG: RNA methyltransferase [Lachnospiraceae bacterium]|nr:RNA methyltransferase [Lachnospiraceae bacterium]
MCNIIHIDSLDIEELQIYRNCNEAQLLHYFEPNGGLFIAESPMVVKRALDAGNKPFSMLMDEALLKNIGWNENEASIREKAECQSDILKILDLCGDIPVYCADEALLGKLIGYKLTRGMLCAMIRPQKADIDEICKGAERIAVLDGVENPTNVGAIFRNAAALGIDALLLTNDCADPLYRRSLRVSMGTVLVMPWAILTSDHNDPKSNDYIEKLHDHGFTTVAMALRDNSVSPDDPELKRNGKIAIVLGNEGFGLSENIISKCDNTVMIPMQRGVDSLNVAAASAIAFWEMRTFRRSRCRS